MELNRKNTETCPFCNAEPIDFGNSLHVWTIEYKCGCSVFGALDTKTFSDHIAIYKECPNKNAEKATH